MLSKFSSFANQLNTGMFLYDASSATGTMAETKMRITYCLNTEFHFKELNAYGIYGQTHWHKNYIYMVHC